jgi:hypothetical protein
MLLMKKMLDDLRSLIDAGAEITGGVIGGVVGFLLTGPAGAVLGGASGPVAAKVLCRLGNDIQKRFLSKREITRIRAVTYYAVKRIQEKIDAGETFRIDDFFQKPLVGRVPAEEIFEGVILAAQREHEEKKLPFLGNLFANIAFDLSIDKSQANLMIKLAKDISFRQMCLLNIFSHTNRYDLRNGNYSMDSFGFFLDINGHNGLSLLN